MLWLVTIDYESWNCHKAIIVAIAKKL